MKRERQHNAAHRFSFGERFDETLMKGYCISCLYIRLSNHQITEFQPLSSPQGKRQHHPCLYAVVPTGNHAGTTAQNIIQGWQKEKGDQHPPTSSPTPPQAFGNEKP